MSGFAKIDVVIPAYNAQHLLRQAVCSIWNTNYAAIHVYVVDDGSTDRTLELAKALASESQGNCHVLQHPGGINRGVSASRNLGIGAGDSPWIAFLDADDEYFPNRFSSFVALQKINAHDDFDALHESARIVSESIDPKNVAFPDGGLFSLGTNIAEEKEDILLRLLRGNAWPCSGIILRRSLLSKTGLFDPRRRIAEDCHLWMRIACLGRVRGGQDGSPVAMYRRHTANTYHQNFYSRLALLDAMVDVAKWSRKVAMDEEKRVLIRRGVGQYALRAIIVAREQNRPDLAWQTLRQMLKNGRFEFLLEPGVARQIAALVRGKDPIHNS